MFNVTITTTATIRPEIFKQTIDSFFKNMFDNYRNTGHQLNLVLNIDPIGGLVGYITDFANIIYNRFDHVLFNTPMIPSFPKAFKKVWENIYEESNYVFNLEDDWELTQSINLLNLINIMENEKDLGILRLAAFHAGENEMKNWNKYFPYNGKYYECPEELKGGLGFCGHPSLIKAEFVRNTAKYLDKNRNPEKQFHSRGRTPIMEEVIKWRYGVYSIPGSDPLIKDIGREWMIKNNFKKQGTKAYFVKWEKEDGLK